MIPTPQRDGARPRSASVRRRFVRVGVATGVVVALVGGGLTAVASSANAATSTATAAKTTTARSSVKIKISDRSYKKGGSPLVTATSTTQGEPTTGKAYFWVSGKLVKIVTLKDGKATYRLSKKLSVGTHRVRATIHPSSSAVKRSTTYTHVTVHKYGSRVVEKAVKYTGVRYVYGGTTPRGFDCSGFTKYVYKKATGKNLPRTSASQRHVGEVVSKKHAKPGDLVYTPGHVAIYVGGNKIIDAPRPGKSIHVRSMWAASWTFIHVTSKATTI